ncbi:hypothetical protein BH09SUM1_BH09SUM1_13380 [soil metagenome]
MIRHLGWGTVVVLVLLSSFLSTVAIAADYPPADHGGADLALADGDRIWGVHTNIGGLAVQTSETLRIRNYDPSVLGTGFVEIHAEDIVVSGTIMARGAGYTGGGGRAGFKNTGHDGKGRYPKSDGSEFVEEGDSKPEGFTDRDSTLIVFMGRGGAGGPYVKGAQPFEEAYGGSGGGGSGGGVVKLFASNSIVVSGTICTDGIFGENGMSGAVGGGGGSSDPEEQGTAGDGVYGCYLVEPIPGSGGYQQICGEAPRGTPGSGGYGGGVILYCEDEGGLLIHDATITTKAADCFSGSNCPFSGTVKMFYRHTTPEPVHIESQFIIYTDLDTFKNDLWLIF